MSRFVLPTFATVCGAVLLTLAGGASSAAPVPKDAGKNDPTPNLKAAFDTVGKAVQTEKWPDEDDERLLKNTARAVFERALKAADQKPRALPVDYANLRKLDVVGEYTGKPLVDNFLITGTVARTSAKNSVIFASGHVLLTTVENCIIVAPSVRATFVYNSTIITGEYLRLVSTSRRVGDEASVLVAGQWIRATTLSGPVCHVIRPGTGPSPDEAKRAAPNVTYPAIGASRFVGAIVLNAQQTAEGSQKDTTFLAPKFPLAK